MFVRENREDSFKGTRALATAHTGKVAHLSIKKKGGCDVVIESASRNFFVCRTIPDEDKKAQRLTVSYAQVASGEVQVKW